jgi:Rieske Fe-S protein
MTRQQFLLLTTSLATGCQTAQPDHAASGGAAGRVVDAGPAEQYAADGVYENFRSQGFFLVRKGGKLFAVSSWCTHRKCKLEAEPDRTFYCPCHGSTFDPSGHVTEGPAVRDLPVYAIRTEGGRLMVTVAG